MIVIEAESRSIREAKKKLMHLIDEKERILIRNGLIDHSFPISLQIAPQPEGERLGFFDPEGNSIVLAEELSEHDTENILLHELAHAAEWHINGCITGHSPEFRKYCRILGVEPGFDRSRVSLSLRKDKEARERIRKLMALSSSPFENEAAEAIKKAQALMMKTDMREEDERICFADIYSSGRIPFYMAEIAEYLKSTAGVFPLTWVDKERHVRIHGTLSQVELAVYIYGYIISSSEREIASLRKKGESISRTAFITGAVRTLKEKTAAPSLVPVCAENRRLASAILYEGRSFSAHRQRSCLDTSSYGKGMDFGRSLDVPDKIKSRLIEG